jgi:hypothetical protein
MLTSNNYSNSSTTNPLITSYTTGSLMNQALSPSTTTQLPRQEMDKLATELKVKNYYLDTVYLY